jgi:hypothetical protein
LASLAGSLGSEPRRVALPRLPSLFVFSASGIFSP